MDCEYRSVVSRIAFDGRDSLRAVRPIWILAHRAERRVARGCPDVFIIDQYAVGPLSIRIFKRDTDLMAEYAHLSSAKVCIDVSSFHPDLHRRQARDVEQEREERNIQ